MGGGGGVVQQSVPSINWWKYIQFYIYFAFINIFMKTKNVPLRKTLKDYCYFSDLFLYLSMYFHSSPEKYHLQKPNLIISYNT